MSNKLNYIEEESENAARLESDYDKLLLENANLVQRISQYVGVCQEILEIANSDTTKKKNSKTIYKTEYLQSYNSLKDIPIMEMQIQAPKNYFNMPTTFE